MGTKKRKSKKLRHRAGYYHLCYKDIDAKDWTLGETMTLKELLDEWWNSVRIKNDKGDEMCCYKNAYTCDPAYEDGNTGEELDKKTLNRMVRVDDCWDEDGDGYPIVKAWFLTEEELKELD